MILKLIQQRKFKEAITIINFDDFKPYFDDIQEAAFDDEDMVYYEFMLYLIQNGHNTAMMHYYTSELMATILNHLPNGYQLGFKHAKIAIKLDPNDISLKEYILLFYDIPDKLLDHNQAKEYAKDILKIDHNNRTALTIFK